MGSNDTQMKELQLKALVDEISEKDALLRHYSVQTEHATASLLARQNEIIAAAKKRLGIEGPTAYEAHALFNYWFEHHGHWMFGTNGKDKAFNAWKKVGIEGLPEYRPMN